VHSPDAHLKTHVEGKQALELFAPSFLQSSGIQNFTTSSLFFQYPFSLAYVVASFGYCSCCSYNTKVEEKKKIATTQDHKTLTSKRNPRTQS
jgi:hypothetical protein